jgi:tetratricopeptide (TPR) repeat protein
MNRILPPTHMGTIVIGAALLFALAAAGCKEDKSVSKDAGKESKPFDWGREAHAKGDYDKAIADYSDVIRLDPRNAPAYYNRSLAYLATGDYGKAIADLTDVVRLNPREVAAYNNLAWLRATCPDPRYRDGKQAVENGNKACGLTNWKAAGCLDTLAAAYAQAGDFERARRWQTEAIDLVAVEKDKTELRARLELYERNEPYREKPKLKAEPKPKEK